MKTVTPPQATTRPQRNLWKGRRKLHKMIRQESSCEIKRVIVSRINSPKVKLWSEILKVPMVTVCFSPQEQNECMNNWRKMFLCICTLPKSVGCNSHQKLLPEIVSPTLFDVFDLVGVNAAIIWRQIWRVAGRESGSSELGRPPFSGMPDTLCWLTGTFSEL